MHPPQEMARWSIAATDTSSGRRGIAGVTAGKGFHGKMPPRPCAPFSLPASCC